jgi:hypothetical protein
MPSKAASVEEYLDGLPSERREAVSKVREVILKNLPAGYEEGIQYGMIGYYIPLARYPKTYNDQPVGLAALGGAGLAEELHVPLLEEHLLRPGNPGTVQRRLP